MIVVNFHTSFRYCFSIYGYNLNNNFNNNEMRKLNSDTKAIASIEQIKHTIADINIRYK